MRWLVAQGATNLFGNNMAFDYCFEIDVSVELPWDVKDNTEIDLLSLKVHIYLVCLASMDDLGIIHCRLTRGNVNFACAGFLEDNYWK